MQQSSGLDAFQIGGEDLVCDGGVDAAVGEDDCQLVVSEGDGDSAGGVGPDSADGAEEAEAAIEDRLDGESARVGAEADYSSIGIEEQQALLRDLDQPGLKILGAGDFLREIPNILMTIRMHDGEG